MINVSFLFLTVGGSALVDVCVVLRDNLVASSTSFSFKNKSIYSDSWPEFVWMFHHSWTNTSSMETLDLDTRLKGGAEK